ncbi:MAG: V-type ATP synthase subunit A [Thermoanaerobaculia bacterium]
MTRHVKPAGHEPARLVRITGSLATVRPLEDAALFELVRVGEAGLLGEVLRIEGETATVQVHEETSGLTLGEPAEATGQPLTLELGPGLLGSILDGVGRPLQRMAEGTAAAGWGGGDFLAVGVRVPTLDPERRWAFEPARSPGDRVGPGDVLGTVEERPGFRHAVLVPPGVTGRLARLQGGEATVRDSVGELEDGTPLRLAHPWPVRRPRPVVRRLAAERPLVTGQRIFDLLFPVAEGGSVAVPGGFGTGKTVIEHSLARFAAADVVVFVGCGERGNEIAEVVAELPALEDPRTGRSLMDRTVLVVNTSNMPVVAREASVAVGLSVAEYYRDQGLAVAVLVDSLSRWAEALREIAGRLQEMPGEEGYPTTLASRVGRLYERSGRAEVPGSPARTGSVTLIGAVSPPGGDVSEPVTQATLGVSGALWALSPELARQRQFPAVDWSASYSLYEGAVGPWFAREAGDDWAGLRGFALELLQREADLREIASLVGADALQDRDRLTLAAAELLRRDVLAQSAFDPADAFSPPAKTHRLVRLVREAERRGVEALEAGGAFDALDLPAVRRALASLRGAGPDELAEQARAGEEAIARGLSAGAAREAAEATP